jgi:hypothetical protein
MLIAKQSSALMRETSPLQGQTPRLIRQTGTAKRPAFSLISGLHYCAGPFAAKSNTGRHARVSAAIAILVMRRPMRRGSSCELP